MRAEPGVTSEAPDRTGENIRAKRRRRSKLERRRIVEETLLPGASVARIARAHGVNANQVFQWRALYKRGLLEVDGAAAGLLPVKIADAARSAVPNGANADGQITGRRAYGRPSPGTISLQLGKAHLCIEGSADLDSLRAVLECLLR